MTVKVMLLVATSRRNLSGEFLVGLCDDDWEKGREYARMLYKGRTFGKNFLRVRLQPQEFSPNEAQRAATFVGFQHGYDGVGLWHLLPEPFRRSYSDAHVEGERQYNISASRRSAA